MSRLISTLRKMQETGQGTATLNSDFFKFFVDEHLQTVEPVLDKQELPDNGGQGRGQAKVRTNKRRPEQRRAIEVYSRINERVVALHQFDTVAAEQYRKLYIEIVQARRTRELQTLLLTSALAGEGKSISALNLAIIGAAHESSHGVLLIDTDLRQPSLHQYLGIRPKWGLADYLLGDVDYSQICFKTQIPGLTVIAAGRRANNPTELFASMRMEHLFRDVKSQKQYSSIILDSSPVLLTSEPKELLQYVDTTVLVVRARKTSAEAVLQAVKTLGEENVLGCVLNSVTSTDFSFHHYYGLS
jgi:protein-tyrosine kinase